MGKKGNLQFDFLKETEGLSKRQVASVRALVKAHIEREDSQGLFPREPARRDAAINSLYRENIRPVAF